MKKYKILCKCGKSIIDIKEYNDRLEISPEEDFEFNSQYDLEYLYLVCKYCKRILKTFNSVEKSKNIVVF